MLCPQRKQEDGSPESPSEPELNSIRDDPDRVATIRSRLSDISWWMRLLCQNIATRANFEDGEPGKFWQSRFKAVRLLDDEALLACAAYVDLNPIRAGLAETVEGSDFTSVQRRIQALQTDAEQASPAPVADDVMPTAEAELAVEAADGAELRAACSADSFLAPLSLGVSATGAVPAADPHRCSDKGVLSLSVAEYLTLLDWTARHTSPGKRDLTPGDVPLIFERLSFSAE